MNVEDSPTILESKRKKMKRTKDFKLTLQSSKTHENITKRYGREVCYSSSTNYRNNSKKKV